ncbi:MAG: SAM-dependent methyltransferase [Myxococcota bacterium]
MAPLRPGDAVVDLGCAPGGWLQVLAERVGGRGLVLGVETRPVEPLGGCVRLLELDFTSPAAPQRIAEELGREATAVFCDAAPRLSGIRDVDRAALEEIHAAALAVCERVLRPGGRLVLKGFPGPASEGVRQELRRRFERVTEVRPQATRRGSREFYWVATGTPRRLSPRRRTRRGTRA